MGCKLRGNPMRKIILMILIFFVVQNVFGQTFSTGLNLSKTSNVYEKSSDGLRLNRGNHLSNIFVETKSQALKNEIWNGNYYKSSKELQLGEPAAEKKSVGKAFFYSLLVPGLGEAYVGNMGFAKLFFSLEVVGWGVFLGNYQYVSWLQNDYKNYARQHAGISEGGKDDDYWINIGKWDAIYGYNEQRRRDRDVDAIYEENAINFWRWDSHSNRLEYDGRRIRARELERNDVYYLGAIVLNHIVSAINALRVAKAHNRNVETNTFQMGMKIDHYNKGVTLSLSHQF